MPKGKYFFHKGEKDMKRIYLIDYLKAVCVIMVIITHYDWSDKIHAVFLFGINMAVPVFMLISGYNFASSGLRKANGEVMKMYQPEMVLPKVVRFTSPFLIIYTIEVILKVAQGSEYSALDIFGGFLEGGYGPGSYHYPLMLQLLIVFPVIFFFVKKMGKWGVVLAAYLNFAYEILIHTAEMELETYRLLIFRYTFLLALGCYLFFNLHNKIRPWVLGVMMCIGIGYLYAIYYADYEPQLFTYWTRTSMMTAFYIFPLIYLVFRYGMKLRIPGILGKTIEKLGQASYHIFLVQMVYYHFDFCNVFEPMPGKSELLVHIAVCLGTGYMFYLGESHFSAWLIKASSEYGRNYIRREYAIQRKSEKS